MKERSELDAHSHAQTELERLRREALGLWAKYARNYRSYPQEYEALLEKRARLGIKPNGVTRMSKSERECYPDIPFLRIEHEEAAEEFLAKLDLGRVKKLIGELEGLELNYAYRTYREKIIDLRWQIDRHERGITVSYYGLNPDAVGGGRRTRSRHIGSED